MVKIGWSISQDEFERKIEKCFDTPIAITPTTLVWTDQRTAKTLSVFLQII
jgi:hypothetical protein